VAASQNFEVDQGSYWSQSLLWKDSAGDPVDVTGYTARMFIREEVPSATTILELESDPAPGGGAGNGRITLGLVEDTPGGEPLYNILLEIEGSATEDLPTGNEKAVWRYDLELLPADDEDLTNRLIKGKFVVFPEVTRP
jgi:hypothetical protein